MTLFLSLVIGAFVFGSIPFGIIFSGKKVNLRTVGSGNTGATNVLRAAGKRAALLTLLFDILKGALPVVLAQELGLDALKTGLVGLSAVLGHVFSIFLGFRGGKGVATGLGVSLIYSPIAGIFTIVAWFIAAGVTRYSSMGALAAFGLLPLNVWLLGYSSEKISISLALALVIIARHQQNISRLLKGTEGKIGKKS